MAAERSVIGERDVDFGSDGGQADSVNGDGEYSTNEPTGAIEH